MLQIASIKLSQTKLLDLYEHIVFELLEKHEYDTVRTMMKSTLALNLMRQQQPSRCVLRLPYSASTPSTKHPALPQIFTT